MESWTQQLDQILREHFAVLIIVWFVAFAGVIAYRIYRKRVRGVVFPAESSVRILYDESFASGRSLRSLWTRLGGARNCLRVTVTESELWVRPIMPFSLLSADFDLEHRIPRDSVVSAEIAGAGSVRLVNLSFRVGGSGDHRLQLRLADTVRFLAAIKCPPPLPRA
jgi:hypothetical protein